MKIKIHFLVFILSATFVSMFSIVEAQDVAKPQVSFNHRKGVDYASEGKFKDAEDWFKKNLEINKGDFTSLSSLVVIKDLKEGKINEEYAMVFFRGINLLQDGSTEEGIIELEKARKLNPAYVRVYSVLGASYASLGQKQNAVNYFKKALEIDPKYIEASFNLAVLYQATGQSDEALNYYKRVMDIDPNSIDANINSAAIFASLGRYKEAIAYYQNAIKLDRLNPDIYYNLALVYFISEDLIKFKDNLISAQKLYQDRHDEKGLQKVSEYMGKIKDLENRFRKGAK